MNQCVIYIGEKTECTTDSS